MKVFFYSSNITYILININILFYYYIYFDDYICIFYNNNKAKFFYGKNKFKKNWLIMITNLFSSFDPSTGFISLNWFRSILFLGFFPFIYWYIPNRNSIFLLIVSKYLNKEFNLLIGSKSIGRSLIFIRIFIFIFYNNFIGLIPYVFTSSSHMVFTISLALPIWISFILYGWINNINHMFCHLVPIGTPFVLIPFMVFIETISNIIRPGSLAVRLRANMIAGHLLMTLLGNRSIDYLIYSYLILLIQIILVLFELAVCIIQSYVFTILRTLYSNEVVYEKSSISYSRL